MDSIDTTYFISTGQLDVLSALTFFSLLLFHLLFPDEEANDEAADEAGEE